ncbi:MAG: helix-turn-helix domain-containing protein [Pyrinomonadaceae bacterium]
MGRAVRAKPVRLAGKLKRIRESLDVSQQTLSERLQNYIKSTNPCKLYPSNISGFEIGEREPSLLILLAYARLAGIDMEVLVDDGLDLPKKLLRVKR